MSKKPVIVFEGIEGSGKTHHINKISNFLKRKKLSFIRIREPGGSLNSEKIRKLILDKKSNFNKNTDLLLYLASRSENIDLLRKYYKKRIILIDGEVVGAINRIPSKNENRSNMHVGGKPIKTSLSKNDKLICEAISPQLKTKGLFFVGIDVIGHYLTEINVTSPTGIREINRLNKTKIEKIFWDKALSKLIH